MVASSEKTGAPPITSRTAIAATMILAVIASSFLLFLPILVGGLSERGITTSQVSVIAAADLGGVSLASLLAVYWINRVRWRTAALSGLLIICVGNLACFLAEDYSLLITLRLTVGIGEGLLMPINLACLSRTKKPDRNFAIFIAAQTVHAMAGLALLPYLVEAAGVNAVFVAMAILGLVALPILRWVPENPLAIEKTPDQQAPSAAQGLNGRAIAILGSIFFFFAVQSGVWTYIERIGSGAGISAAAIGTALATGAFVGLIGALTAAGIAARFGRAVPLIFTAIFQAVSIMLLLDKPVVATFFAASALFQFFWNFGIPFQMGVMSRADPMGSYVVLVTAVTGAGFTAGPLIAAPVLERTSVGAFVGLEVFLCALSLALILPVALQQSSGESPHE